MCLSLLCCCCKTPTIQGPKGTERIGYCVILIVALLAALVLRSQKIPIIDEDLFSPLVVFRVFFAIALFYSLLAGFVAATPSLQSGHWCLKSFLVLVLFLITFMLPDSLFLFYGRISQFLGGFFLFVPSFTSLISATLSIPHGFKKLKKRNLSLGLLNTLPSTLSSPY
ncbi:hypothetical protein GEMRC1_002634 [Eukaryota sp. GEM-RC1]